MSIIQTSNLKPQTSNQEETICAIATAPGGAIGIVRVSGPEAVAVTFTLFSKDLSAAAGNTLHHGMFHSPSGDTIDEVVVSIYRAPHSYTGEECTEISCHGSRFVLQRVVDALCQQGCRMAEPGEFTQRAFLAGKIDLSQAEAVADLIASENSSQHRLALSQLRGGITTRLQALRGLTR